MSRPDLLTPIPGPRSRELADQLRRVESRNVTHLATDWPIFWERADGVNVWDADGNRFLDLTSAFGVCGLGHTNPAVRDALIAQSATLSHAMGDVHPTARKVELCTRLSELTFERWGAGPGKTVLGNSGFEAVEVALKTSLLWSGKSGVLAFAGSYHGLGFGALAVTELPYFRGPFRSALKEFATFAEFPASEDAMSSAWSESIRRILASGEIGCVLVEPIQGRGGCVVPPPAFLPTLREWCDEFSVLLVLDEIYTGFNRTGRLFACDHSGVAPDLICLGKGLTNGFPLSACVGHVEVMDAWPESPGEALHTSTYLGHPLGCAMALASLAIHADPAVAADVARKGEYFIRALQALDSPSIREVRGAGLMIGLELIDDRGAPATDLSIRLMKQALRDGLVLLADSPTSNVLSFSPPFAISEEEMDFVVEWLRAQLASHR